MGLLFETSDEALYYKFGAPQSSIFYAVSQQQLQAIGAR